MPRVWTIVTPENVLLDLELANPLERGVALLIDSAITVLITIPVALALAVLSQPESIRVIIRLGGLDVSGPCIRQFVHFYAFALPLIIVAYHSLLEGLYGGQTLGKKLMNLRVIRNDGTIPDLTAALIRNALRFIDYMPCTCGIGFMVMLLSAQFRRLGDYAAGTLVIRGGRTTAPPLPEEELPSLELQVLTPLAAANIGRLSSEQILALRYFLLRAPQLPQDLRERMARELALKVANLLWEGNPPENFPAERLIEEVVGLYRERFRQ